MNKTRDIQMDILRGLGIIIIVLGHCGFPYTNFIYLFHLAIFFMLSGFFWKESSISDEENLKHYIIDKIKRLYIPYIIGNIIGVLLNNFFISTNIYNNINHHYYTINDIIINIIKVLLFRGTTEIFGATWFLRILFTITILYTIIEYVLNKCIFKDSLKNIVQIIISVILLFVGMYLSEKNIDLKIIDIQSLVCYILFYLGRQFRRYKTKIHILNKPYILLSSFFLLVLLNNMGSIEISRNEYTNIAYFLSVSILGWNFVYAMSYYFAKLKIINNSIAYIGKNTMPILIYHFVAFKIINIIAVLILKENIELISIHPTSFSGGLWWILYTISGIFIPLGVNKLITFIKSNIKHRREI